MVNASLPRHVWQAEQHTQGLRAPPESNLVRGAHAESQTWEDEPSDAFSLSHDLSLSSRAEHDTIAQWLNSESQSVLTRSEQNIPAGLPSNGLHPRQQSFIPRNFGVPTTGRPGRIVTDLRVDFENQMSQLQDLRSRIADLNQRARTVSPTSLASAVRWLRFSFLQLQLSVCDLEGRIGLAIPEERRQLRMPFTERLISDSTYSNVLYERQDVSIGASLTCFAAELRAINFRLNRLSGSLVGQRSNAQSSVEQTETSLEELELRYRIARHESSNISAPAHMSARHEAAVVNTEATLNMPRRVRAPMRENDMLLQSDNSISVVPLWVARHDASQNDLEVRTSESVRGAALDASNPLGGRMIRNISAGRTPRMDTNRSTIRQEAINDIGADCESQLVTKDTVSQEQSTPIAGIRNDSDTFTPTRKHADNGTVVNMKTNKAPPSSRVPLIRELSRMFYDGKEYRHCMGIWLSATGERAPENALTK